LCAILKFESPELDNISLLNEAARMRSGNAYADLAEIFLSSESHEQRQLGEELLQKARAADSSHGDFLFGMESLMGKPPFQQK
jgi:hypothetical protein